MTSLRRSKKRQNPDPLGISVSKRHDSDDKVPNDWLEAVVIFLALMAMTGAGIALYYLSEQV